MIFITRIMTAYNEWISNKGKLPVEEETLLKPKSTWPPRAVKV